MLCNTDTSVFRWRLQMTFFSPYIFHLGCVTLWGPLTGYLGISTCISWFQAVDLLHSHLAPLLHALRGGEEQQCGVNGQFYLAANSLPLPPPLLWPTTTPSTPALVVSIHLLHNLPLRPTKQQFNCNHLARRIGSKELSGISTVKSWVSACDTIWPPHAGTPAMPNLTGLTCTVNTSSTNGRLPMVDYHTLFSRVRDSVLRIPLAIVIWMPYLPYIGCWPFWTTFLVSAKI